MRNHTLSMFIRSGLLTLGLLLGACQPATPEVTDSATATPTETLASLSPTVTFVPPTPTAQPSTVLTAGPNADDFPAGINPLTGLPVEDASLLKLPAMLISISHFPATARPQAGLSFANFVYEISITEGASRFLSVFYGQYPEPEIPVTGDCAVRVAPFPKTDPVLGNRVWLDANKDGQQQVWEAGVGGICVNLLDASTNEVLQQTTTDSNGYYGFNVRAGTYVVEVVKLADWDFSAVNVGDENADSDADVSTGRTRPVVMGEADVLDLDAGLVAPAQADRAAQTSTPMPLAQVGPVRSGRLVYADIAAFYQNSCLIYAFASEEVLEKIPKCAFVTHEVQGGGFMLGLDRMREIAEDHARKNADKSFNYAANLFTEVPPAGGAPAVQMNEYWAYLNQSGWFYDGASQTYWRYVDDSTKVNAGKLHPEVERLTGRQLQFENVIVIMADVDVVSPTNLDIHLEQGDGGPAFLFRNGMKYDIRWSTKTSDYEKKSGLRQPMRFLNSDGTPAALKPGHTWVIVLTPWSRVESTASGVWLLRYSPPAGEK